MASTAPRLTKQQISSRVKEFDFWLPHLKVVHYFTSEVVSLSKALSPAQKDFLGRVLAAEAEGRPGRFIICKSRRLYMSTICAAVGLQRSLTRKHFPVRTICDKDENSQSVHGLAETMWDYLPDPLRTTRPKFSAGAEMGFGNKSSMKTLTAGSRSGVGRGGRAMMLHLSEYAWWPNADTTTVSLFSVVADAPGTLIVKESTPNGAAGAFYEDYQRAKRGDDAYEALFYPWYAHPEYQRAVPVGGLGQLDDLEQALKQPLLDPDDPHDPKHWAPNGVTDEQLAWRRHTIANTSRGRVEDFMQEYPADDLEAFRTSGSPYFDQKHLRRFVSVRPLKRGSLQGDLERKSKISFRQDPEGRQDGYLRIYEVPVKDHRYAIFADLAGEIGPEERVKFTDPKDAEDYSCLWTVDLMNGHTAAVWHGRDDIDFVAEESARLGTIYNKAVICPEMNKGLGTTVIAVLKRVGYTNIYRSRNEPDRVNSGKVRMGLGWWTTSRNRMHMLQTLEEFLRDHPELLRCDLLRNEMERFVVGRGGKPQAAAGNHDDTVMAAAGAYCLYAQLAQKAPDPKRAKRMRETLVKQIHRQSVSRRAAR